MCVTHGLFLMDPALEWEYIQNVQLTDNTKQQEAFVNSQVKYDPNNEVTQKPVHSSYCGDTCEFTFPSEKFSLSNGNRIDTENSDSVTYSQCRDHLRMHTSLETCADLTISPNSFLRKFSLFHCLLRPLELSSNLRDERAFVYSLSCTKCCPFDIPLHGKMLVTIFKRLTGSGACLLKGVHWELIGFQGSDPTTDFRSTGLLSLVCLVYFVTDVNIHGSLSALFRQSLDPVQHFPFCSVGINITGILLQLLRRGVLNQLCIHRNSVLDTFMRLFTGMFCCFCKTWKDEHCTILNAQTVFDRLEKLCRKNPRSFLKMHSNRP
ncbi:ELMO domain-containing protein 3 [Paragonimus heterotremus]|uniref:ELMO domain-containing protein 3 n=1 Tax=Paragonimus heterotremus TaxID=100268 RepID=A0A8J4X3B7_9TREM|nr:ELMO domain-containing protein 3 [Paragonimus heterotremus]